MSVIVETVTIVLTTDKTLRNSEGLALQVSNIVADTTHTLMTRFIDVSLESLLFTHLNSNDFYTSPESISEGHSLLGSSSQGPFFTLKTTYYMPQSVLAGRLLMHISLASFKLNLDSHLLPSFHLVHSFIDPIRTTLDAFQSTETVPSPIPLSPDSVQLLPQRDLEIHMDSEGCIVYIQSNDVLLNVSLRTVSYSMNTREKIEHELSVDSLGLVLNDICFLELGDGSDLKGVLVSLSSSRELNVSLAELRCVLNPFIQLDLFNQLLQVASHDHSNR